MTAVGLTPEQEQEVDTVMELALDWLMAWDVVGQGKDALPPNQRVAAMLRLREAVKGLARRANPI